jgi:hypothetical protein
LPALVFCTLSAVLPASAGAELVLDDGQVLTGLSVERKDGYYNLELESGSILTLPVLLVVEVRLTGDDAPEEEPPTGIRVTGPEVLAGPPEPVRPPRTSEQMQVFREPAARFPRNLIDQGWRPENDWETDPELTNNFNPATWARGVVDPTWQPQSAYRTSGDVTNFSPARWLRGVVDSTWYPRESF